MEQQSFNRIVDTCRRHGDKDTSLWQHALSYLAQEKKQDCKEYIEEVIRRQFRCNSQS